MPATKLAVVPVDYESIYSEHVNHQWVRLVSLLGMNKDYVHCQGSELKTAEGETYLDFLSGYGVYNVGHHHPLIKQRLIEEIGRFSPTMLQTHVPKLAAILAQKLCRLAGGGLTKVFFTSTGSEGVETAIKFSRAHTRRQKILYGNGGFHGLTYGALSLMSNPWWRDRFGPMLEDSHGIPFGDLETLKRELETGSYAAFVIEPIQGESGITVPTRDYLRQAQALCRKHSTLFVLDEVQTGLYRTGTFIAAHGFGVEPDMVILAKAMSGGFVPVGAVLMREGISNSVFRSIDKAFVHASTFGENALAMQACLATLEVMEQESVGARATVLGKRMREGIQGLVGKYEMLKGAHGVGMFNGIELQAPTSLKLKLLFSGFNMCHPGLLGQMVVRQLFHQSHILTQMCGNNYLVIKAIPPLTSTEAQIDEFVNAVDKLLDGMENGGADFWQQGLVIGKNALGL